MSKRPSFNESKAKALANDPALKAEYEALAPMFEMKRKMIAMRKEKGVTQEQMAELLSTKKSNISRLESLNADSSPKLATIENYAKVLGYSVHVDFEPAHQ